MKRIYLSPPHMGASERKLLLDAFDSNWIAPLGPHVDAFECEVAQYVGVAHALALSSGTAAIHLALQILGVGQGDVVVTSTLTFAATAFGIRYVGAEPVFIDAEATSWNMDPRLLEVELEQCANRGRLPKAVLVVDLYGQCADYASIGPICAKYGVPIIEDAAEALGATCGDHAAGRFGVMGAYSFNGNKIITTGGGGMLVSDNGEFVERARFLSTQARDPAPHYQHSHVGFNYRMSNLLAAVGRGQLRVLDDRVSRRRAINARYRELLGDLPGLDFLPEAPWGRSNCWLTCILVDRDVAGTDREQIRLALEAADIESRPVWKPMHKQPVFAGCRVRGGSVAEDLFDRGLCLPSGSAMTEDDLLRVATIIRKAWG